ncbi:GAF domain-containing protein [Deltaproteobacteria bacterium]|nr:GAF domain-containing protein [Deltaproteobacteria bacterium]
MFNRTKSLLEIIKKEEWVKTTQANDEFWEKLEEWINDVLLPEFMTRYSHQVDEIILINPDLSERKILELIAMYMVKALDARYASVRIYAPDTEQMLSFGSYPSGEEARETQISPEKSIAGEVVKTGHAFFVSNIMEESLYLDKTIIDRIGAHSMMAVPFEIPRFFPHEQNTAGVIQVYFPENDRDFTPLEVQIAELMSRRLSFVIARKKILSMHMVNEKKEAIVRQIFLKPGAWQGVKMKDAFNRLIPELADIVNLQSCALFSVSDDLKNVILDAGYPDSISHHGIGKSFPINSEPAFELVLGLRKYTDETPYELVTPSYVLVIDPGKSVIVSDNVKRFAMNRNINSILYVPLTREEDISHFMTFDALDQRKGYTPEEIEIFLFLGRELMKAQRLERLDDILHDFKNPAIATAGFARRVNQLLEKKGMLTADSKIKKYLNVLLEETSRLQEMALSISHIGKEQMVNLTEVLKRRFEINKEAIKEQLKQNVTLEEGPFKDPLYIMCYPLHIERVMDNILNNATNAIPIQGGTLSVRSYEDGDSACVEVANTGVILDEERRRLLEGEVQGRGFYITHRIIRLLRGNIDIRSGKDTTTVSLRLPIRRVEGNPETG